MIFNYLFNFMHYDHEINIIMRCDINNNNFKLLERKELLICVMSLESFTVESYSQKIQYFPKIIQQINEEKPKVFWKMYEKLFQ